MGNQSTDVAYGDAMNCNELYLLIEMKSYLSVEELNASSITLCSNDGHKSAAPHVLSAGENDPGKAGEG